MIGIIGASIYSIRNQKKSQVFLDDLILLIAFFLVFLFVYDVCGMYFVPSTKFHASAMKALDGKIDFDFSVFLFYWKFMHIFLFLLFIKKIFI